MAIKTVPHVGSDRGSWLFLALQVVVLALFATAGVAGSREFLRPPQLPELREQPLTIRPRYDCPDVVTDEQLRRVDLRLRPRLDGKKTLLANVDHALRCWGATAEFKEPEFVSGAELRRLLVDHRRFAELYGSAEPALLIDKGPGVAVRTKEGLATSSHTDHTVACLAEVGTPLSFPVVTPERDTTYRVLVEQTLREFNLFQEEYEWSAKVSVLFLPPITQWRAMDGQQLSFDRLARRIMRDPWRRGVCWGQHRLFGLVCFLRVDEQIPILSRDTRERVYQFLNEATQRLVADQHADGFWNDDWSRAKPATLEPSQRDGDQLGDRLLVTGHVLEWWALAPQEVQPPRKVLVAAAQWLVRTVEALPEQELQQNYAFLSHAARALALWRGCEPVKVLEEPRVDAGG